MSRVTATVVLLLVLGLTACSAPVSGVVVGKDYQPQRFEQYLRSERYRCGSETYTTITYSGTGSTRTSRPVTRTRSRYCTRQVPDTRRIPADWDLFVQDDQGKTHTVDVSRAEYSQYQVNDRYDSERKNR